MFNHVQQYKLGWQGYSYHGHGVISCSSEKASPRGRHPWRLLLIDTCFLRLRADLLLTVYLYISIPPSLHEQTVTTSRPPKFTARGGLSPTTWHNCHPPRWAEENRWAQSPGEPPVANNQWSCCRTRAGESWGGRAKTALSLFPCQAWAWGCRRCRQAGGTAAGS